MIFSKTKVRYKLSCIATLFLLTTLSVFGQEGDPVSNMPSGFGINQSQTSENLSSGVLNINLPIESAMIPISLSYTTSGIRVNQRAGLVGLGWNLNAGGAIVRQKRGFADDHEQGYSGEFKRGTAVLTSPSESNFHHLVGIRGEGSGTPSPTPWDTEPDIYHFQFLGQGGTFTMDPNRNVVKLSANLLKVTPDYNTITNKYDGFKITDQSGNVYEFTIKESVRTLVDDVEAEEFTYKWHLSSMISYMTGEVMTFGYDNAPLYTESTPFRSRRWDWGTTNDDSSEDKGVEQEYTAAKLLTSVSYKNSKVEFAYGNRTDITNLKKLDGLSYKTNGVQSVYYSFQYKYLGSAGAERLMLAGVTKSALNTFLFQFSYFGEESGEPILPVYNSNKQDHWGFYNTNVQSTLYEKIGANRSPNLTNTRANSLKRVYDTNGGYEEYEYQLNEYRLGGADYSAGGLRVSKLHKRDGESVDYEMRVYNYDIPGTSNSSGEIYNEPDYDFKYTDLLANETLEEHREFSMKRLSDDQGRHVIYEYVTATDIDGGKTQLKYKTFTDERSLLGTGVLPASRRFIKGWNRPQKEYETPSIVNLSLGGPFGFDDFKGVAAGLPEEKLIMDANSNWLSREVYLYLTRAPTTTAKGLNHLRQGYRRYGSLPYKRIDEFLVSVYELGNGYLLPNRTDVTTYDRANSSKYRTTVSETSYDADHPLPIKQENYLFLESATTKRSSETDYLFRESGLSQQMADSIDSNNLLGLVKESRSLTGTTEVAKNSKTYNLISGNKVAVWADYSYSRGDLTGFSYIYYRDGYPVRQEDGNSQFNSSTIFDDYGRVLAEASNTTDSRIAYTSFQMDDSGGWTVPALTSPDDCLQPYFNCVEGCNPTDQNCLNSCLFTRTTCEDNASLTEGHLDSYAFKLSKGNVTKSLIQGTYKVSFWKKTGTVNLNGTNTLLETKTFGDWTFEAWQVVLSSATTLAVSGTAVIDHLAVSPEEASMTAHTYHPIFGKSAEMDASNDFIMFEYDGAGRQIIVRDENNDILSYNTYHTAGYLDLSSTALSVGYSQSSSKVFVTANQHWTVSSNATWATWNRDNNSPIDGLTISSAQNTTQSARTATLTLSTAGLADQTIVVTQAAAPNGYITVPTSVTISGPGSASVLVSSNVSWTATIEIGGNDLNISGGTGQNNGSFTVSLAPQQPGLPSQNGPLTVGSVRITGGGITKFISVVYNTAQ